MGPRFVVVNPCAKRWQDLRGDGRERHCDECHRDVHAIEQYSPEEWDQLWRASNGCLCGLLGGESAPEPRSRREIIIGVLLTAVAPLMAQSGRVRIVVKDAAGGAVPSAEAWLEDRKDERVGANGAGEIVLTGLPMGNVKVVVTALGFNLRPVTIVVRNAGEARAEVTLELGTVGTVIQVPTASDTETSSEIPTLTISTQPADKAEGPPRKKRRRWWIFR